MSVHRTAALQIEVARHPQVALAALVHGMVQTILQDSHYGHDLPLGVRLTAQGRLEGMAPDWPDSPAAVALRELQEVAGEALPQNSDELFAALLAMEQDELVRLLAVCVAATVNVVTPRATVQQPGAELAQAVGLDMAAWWKPTAEGYFKHVSKAVILEAVGEFAPSHISRLAKLKKGDIASEAERLADGTGWMPAVFSPCRVRCGGSSKPKNSNSPGASRRGCFPKSGRGGRPPHPVSTSKAKPPRRRLRRGDDVASAQVPCARYGDQCPLTRAALR